MLASLFVVHCFEDCFVLFFLQAEDGIRDKLVTGVQTCALPIWPTLATEVTHPLRGFSTNARCRVDRGERREHTMLKKLALALPLLLAATARGHRAEMFTSVLPKKDHVKMNVPSNSQALAAGDQSELYLA